MIHFIQGLQGYQNALRSSGLLRNDGTWNLITFKRKLSTKGRKSAILLLRGGALKKFTLTSHNAKDAARLSTSAIAARQRENNRKAAIATTSVILGTGAFWIARRRAKKR